MIEINFEKNPELYNAFSTNEPSIILRNIELIRHLKINIDQSIFFLDEVQVFPELIAKLRWFYESLPALPVIAAGSLLDFALAEHTFSMPVGRISYLHINPFSFEEFLIAKKCENLVSFLEAFQLKDSIPSVIHDRMMNLFREYLVVGGMPAAVHAWITTNSLHDVAVAHSELVLSYRDNTIIPIEVKSGKTGSLKSLQVFMQLKQRRFAVRINSDVPSFVAVNVKSYDGKPVSYELLSIPFYLLGQLPRLLDLIITPSPTHPSLIDSHP